MRSEAVNDSTLKPQYTLANICKADGLIKYLSQIKHVVFYGHIYILTSGV